MSVLVTTLRKLLQQADAHFAAGRLGAARRDYEGLLERSQERTDRAMEVVARSMLARVYVRRRDLDRVREELGQAARVLDPNHLSSHARYRAALARLAMAESPETAASELRDYLTWADSVGATAQSVDAALLLASVAADDRLDWIQRAIDTALEAGLDAPLGDAYTRLATALDQDGHLDDALEAYQQALVWHRRSGGRREIVAAEWAVGAAGCRAGDWPLARTHLENAVADAEHGEDCVDLLALALADLAQVNEASGDVIEARRLVLRAMRLGREQDLAQLWPERWSALLGYARRLEVY